MSRLRITEVALRDGHQSLLATRMVTADMLPAAPLLDKVGFWSLETWGGATFDTCMRFLNEDPWQRIRALKAAMPHTPMQMLVRGQNLLGYRHYADDVVERFVDRAAANGVEVFRIFDALNDPRNLVTCLRAVKSAGKHAQAAISYASTPVHTIASYVDLATQYAAMGADSLCIKDMAGLLMPYEAYELVRAIKRVVSLPLQMHSHATTGMSVATLVKCVEAGADGVDTAISSLASGTSHSPTETIVEIFKGTEHDARLDLKLLVEIAAHFRDVRKKYREFESSFLGADTRILVSQVPGGMLSNLESQLKGQKASHRIDDVLTEIAAVQRDFGYPPLVTPTSQIVGTQAVFNVLMGRYEKLTTESCDLLAGNYGRTPAPPDAELVQRALKQLGRAKPTVDRPADALPNEMAKIEAELKSKAGTGALSTEDALSYAMFPQVALEFFKTRDRGPVVFNAPAEPAAAATKSAYDVVVDGTAYRVDLAGRPDGALAVTVDGAAYEVTLTPRAAGAAPAAAPAAPAGGPSAPPAGASARVLAPMPGTVVRLLREDGASVAAGDAVVQMEAMKMQLEIKTSAAGRIRYRAKAGDAVEGDAVLAEIS